ncbi:MAG: RsmE family RNA methyltransferase [candidate division WOR-3 bacterium]
MRIDRFFSDDFEFIKDEEFHHLYNVLRHKIGDKILVFDGKSNEYLCEIIEIQKDKAKIKKIQKIENKEYNFNVAVAPALIKREKFELILEKVVEIGVKEIYPVITKYSVVKLKEKKERWERIILNACKQSHRQIIPKLHDIKTLEEVVQISKDYSLRLFANPKSNKNLFSFGKTDNVIILIGPEGGFSDEEENYLKLNGFSDFSLGNFILRSETAVIVSVGLIVHFLNYK